MKISVIVPIYNSEKYLRPCIESILNQTLSEIEIILINDGSTDSSLDICREYASKDSRIRIIEQSNQGVGAARNSGLENAKGEYIGFVDSDDYIMPNMYQELYESIRKFRTDIAICKRIIPKSKQEYGHCYPIEKVFSFGDSKCDWKEQYYRGDVETFVTNKLFDRRLIVGNGIRFPHFPILEDKIFLQDIYLCNPQMVYIDKELYVYRAVEGSSVRKYHENRYLIVEKLHEKDKELCFKYEKLETMELVLGRMVGDIYNCIMQEQVRKPKLQWERFEQIRQSKENRSIQERVDVLEITKKKRKLFLLLMGGEYQKLSLILTRERIYSYIRNIRNIVIRIVRSMK